MTKKHKFFTATLVGLFMFGVTFWNPFAALIAFVITLTAISDGLPEKKYGEN